MGKAFLIASFLCASGPAMAFDMAEFLATMSLGKPVVVEPAPTQAAIPTEKTAPVPPTKDEAADDKFSPDAIWMIGVFR